ncbi:MAG: hypothetical protein ACI9J5_002737 [Paraglaciecola sp.]|jgi:hypothetical protein
MNAGMAGSPSPQTPESHIQAQKSVNTGSVDVASASKTVIGSNSRLMQRRAKTGCYITKITLGDRHS